MTPKTKKALVFTASTGGGHNAAANAIKNTLSMDAMIVDVFKELAPEIEWLVEDGYYLMLKWASQVYGKIYKTTGKSKYNKMLNRLIFKVLKRRIIDTINTLDPSVVIVTHPIFVQLLGQIKDENYPTLKLMVVVTDLGAHPFYKHSSVDAYITALDHTKNQLCSMGIKPQNIYNYGIPVSERFYSPVISTSVKKSVFSILLMGGSLGDHKIYDVLLCLFKVDWPIAIHVVCGKNDKLYNQINALCPKCPSHIELSVYPFVEDMNQLMGQVDLLISKPGGLTLTEAILKSLPIMIPFFIKGQEEENLSILLNEGIGIYVSQIDKMAQMVMKFIENPDHQNQIKSRMKKISSEYNLNQISVLCERLLESA